MRRLTYKSADFDRLLATLLSRSEEIDSALDAKVRAIIKQIRQDGDTALLAFTQEFDRLRVEHASALEVPKSEWSAARGRIGHTIESALIEAANRIREFHEHQKEQSWQITTPDGNRLGQQVTPMDRVGIYVPGGKAAYPSSVLMNAIPASVAGVPEIIMVVPAPDGEVNDTVLACAELAGVNRVFRIGGAQAVAALAYGTETIPRVDKIVGPGNQYVAMAKKQVFGDVGIDMIAGPSEVVVICDAKAPLEWVAMDLFAQAEHDEQAQSIAICVGPGVADRLESEVYRALPQLERASIVAASLANHGALIEVESVEEAVDIANRIAPEHLELMFESAQDWVSKIRHAGAIFCGYHSAESLGDYCAGPNHVLPTSGTARFSSPLGVYDFQKRSSVIHCSDAGALALSEIASVLARAEGLTAHARSAEFRGAQEKLGPDD